MNTLSILKRVTVALVFMTAFFGTWFSMPDSALAWNPKITVLGPNPYEMTEGDAFTDPGATAIGYTDHSMSEEVDITADIVVSGDSISSATPSGTYTIKYNVTDSHNLKAKEKTRTVIVNVKPAPVFVGPSCGFSPQDGRVIVNFPTDREIRSDQQENDAHTIPVATVIPSGLYDVTLVSYDGYADRVNVSQSNESWAALLRSSNNISTLAETNASGDLQDRVLEASSTTLVNTNFVVPAGVEFVKAYHAAYPDTTNANGVVPVCAVFDKKADANTPPTIMVLGNNPFTLTVGYEFTDPGATSTDAEDGDLTDEIVVSGDTVASTTPIGSYTISYSVTDSGGLSASTTRTVVLQAASTPTPTPSPTPTPPAPSGSRGGGSPPAQCSDNTDNDSDGLIDRLDPGCHTDGNAGNPDSYNYVDNDEMNSGGSLAIATTTPASLGGGGPSATSTPLGTGASSGAPTTTPAISSDTCDYLHGFIKRGWNNDPTEVMKLQSFLSIFDGASLMVNGVYDDASYNAVVKFQEKYFNDILAPWGHDRGTGFVYLTTRKKVNEIYCNRSFPLTWEQQAEVAAFKTYLESLAKETSGDGTTDASGTSGGTLIPAMTEDGRNIDDVVGSIKSTGSNDLLTRGETEEETKFNGPAGLAAAIIGGVMLNLLESYWFVLLLVLILVFYFVLRSFYDREEEYQMETEINESDLDEDIIIPDEYQESAPKPENEIHTRMEIPEKPKDGDDKFTNALFSGSRRDDHKL